MTAQQGHFLTSHVIEPAGWMLVHSVWQLACLAALLALLVRIFNRHSPELRYALSALVLVAMVAAPAATFWLVLPAPVPAGLIVTAPGHQKFPSTFPHKLPPPPLARRDFGWPRGEDSPAAGVQRDLASEPSPSATVQRWLRPAFPWLVGAWAIGVVGLSTWNIGGWIAMQRLLHLGIRPVSEQLRATTHRLARRIHLSRAVRVVQSVVVEVPSVVGWLRPTILLPGYILTGLSPQQLEAILAHELAHIRRSDYLANLLQTIAETLLFYHPGAWFVSRRMRIEREYCADRLAGEAHGNPTTYAKALAALEDHARTMPQFVLGASSGNLLHRVQRIFGLETNDGGRTGSWLIGAAASLTVLLVLFASPSIHAALARGSAPVVTMHRVWADVTTDISGRVSPNGRYIAYINWDNGNLGVHDLEGGISRELTTDGTWQSPNRWAESPIWSPDSKQLAYTWFQDDQPAQLRILSLAGGEPRTLYTAAEGGFVYTGDWSPDGRHILASLRDAEERSSMALMHVADGSVLHLRDLPHGWPVAFSPDGRFVAFTQPSAEHAGRDIHLYELATGESTPLIEHPADDHSPLWSPDGRWLTFLSSRSGDLAAWMVPVEEGKTQGSARQMSPQMHSGTVLGFSQRGMYFFGHRAPFEIFVVDYDPQTGRVKGEPRLLVRHFEGRNYNPVWSPDAKMLAFVSVRPTPRGGRRRMPVVRDEATGREMINDTDLKGYIHLAWQPDGKALLFQALTRSNEPRIFRWDLERGTTAPVVTWDRTTKGSVSFTFAVSREGTALFYSMAREGTAHVIRRQLQSGEEEKIAAYPATNGPKPALSPSGKLLALTGAYSIRLVDLDTRELRLLHEWDDEKNQLFHHGVTWTRDGQHLLFWLLSTLDKTSRSSLWRISVQGGDPTPVGLAGWKIGGLGGLDVHPDGRRIAFSAGRAAYGSEVWAIENSLLVRDELIELREHQFTSNH